MIERLNRKDNEIIPNRDLYFVNGMDVDEETYDEACMEKERQKENETDFHIRIRIQMIEFNLPSTYIQYTGIHLEGFEEYE